MSVIKTELMRALLRENLITMEQLEDAHDKQLGAKKPICEILSELNFVSEKDLIRTTAVIYDIPRFDESKDEIDPEVVKILPYEKAKRYGVFPIRQEGEFLILAMEDSKDIVACDDVELITELRVKPILASLE